MHRRSLENAFDVVNGIRSLIDKFSMYLDFLPLFDNSGVLDF